VLDEKEKQIAMCKKIDQLGAGVTPWEEEFVASVARLLRKGVKLSVRQQKTLETIFDQRV
jgi:hypothetical protein